MDEVILGDEKPRSTGVLPMEEEKSRLSRPQRTKSIRKIKISCTEERGAKLTKYHVYLIATEPPLPGVVSVARRYNDFKWLRSMLSRQFPGIFVPPLPPPRTFGKLEANFVQERLVDLERFLNRVEEVKPFAESEIFPMFLSRPETTFAEGKKEMEDKINPSPSECTYELQNLYPDLHEQEFPEQIFNEEAPRLREFLVKVEAQMKLLDTHGTKLIENLDSVCNEIKVFNESLNNLYVTENQYPYKSSERIDIRSQSEQWYTYQNKTTDVYYQCVLKELRYEHQDVQAFLELFNHRDNIVNKYAKAKTKADKWRQKATDNIELKENEDQQKQKDLNEEKELLEFLTIVTKIMLKNEIYVVWSSKIEQWRKQIYEFAKIQSEHTNKMLISWESIKEQQQQQQQQQ